MTAQISGISMKALCCLSPQYPLGGYRYSLHRTRDLNTSKLRYKNVSNSQNVSSPVGNPLDDHDDQGGKAAETQQIRYSNSLKIKTA